MFIGAGTSSQNQSLWPSVISNETRVASNEFCTGSIALNCNDPKFTHGHFSSDISGTWKSTPNYASLDTTSAHDSGNLSTGTDHLNIYTHYFDPSPASKFIVEDHPISIISDYTSTQDVFFNSGSLGLGSSSTVLTHLRNAGRIGRNVVGLYLGTAYPRAGGVQNGSVVLGGYDAGRIAGVGHEYSLSTLPLVGLSPLKVHVKQISLVTQDGTSIALITDDGFDGYISTTQYEMELPQALTQRLADALGGSVSPGSGEALQLKKQFRGNMTVTLDDGYQINFPSEWISNTSGVTPFSSSSLQTNNSSKPTQYVLGASFLHHLYTTIDYDASKFYLSDVKMSNNYVQPQALCAGAVPMPMAAPNISKFTQSGMIGGIIGGVFAGFGAAWLAIFYVRKRLQYKQSQDRINAMEKGGPGAPIKRSILRNKAKGVLSLRSKRTKSVVFKDVKRVSHSDSDTSSVKGPVVSVSGAEDNGPEAGIELSSIRRDATDGDPKREDTPPPSYNVTASSQNNLPNPERFANPYASSPLPTPMMMETPRTGNPLLGNFHENYSQYDDKDDSDLYPSHCESHKMGHQRVASDHLRHKLGLRVKTSPSTSRKGLRKSIPPPVKIVSDPSAAAKAATANRQSPSFRMLRKVFPAS